MRVRIEGSGVFADMAKANPEMDGVATVADLLQRLDIASLGGYLILVNDRLATPDNVLRDGDAVHLVPTVGGGSK